MILFLVLAAACLCAQPSPPRDSSEPSEQDSTSDERDAAADEKRKAYWESNRGRVKQLREDQAWDELQALALEWEQQRADPLAAHTAWSAASKLLSKSQDPEWKLRWLRFMHDIAPDAHDERLTARTITYLAIYIPSEELPTLTREVVQIVDAMKKRKSVEETLEALIVLGERALHSQNFGVAELAVATVLDRATSELTLARGVGLRGATALDRGQVEIAADAFERERQRVEQAAPSVSPQDKNGRSDLYRARYASLKHRIALLLATGQLQRLDLTVEELLNSEVAADLEFVSEAQLHQALAHMDDERLRPPPTLQQSTAARLLLGIAERSESNREHRSQAYMRLAHIACNAGETALAAEYLAQVAAAPDPREQLYRVVLQHRVARHPANARDSGEVARISDTDNDLEQAWRRLQDQWRHAPETDQGAGHLHFARTRLFLSELIEWRLWGSSTERRPPTREAVWEALRVVERAREFGSLQLRLRASSREVGDRRALTEGDPREMSLEQIRRELTSDVGGCIVVFPTPDRSHLFVVTASGLSHYQLPPRDAIEEIRRELLRELRRVPRVPAAADEGALQTFHELTEQLSRKLLPPEVAHLIAGWKHLYVVGADLVGEIPWLELSLGKGLTLGDRCSVSLLPSLAVGVELSMRARARRQQPMARSKGVLLGGPQLPAVLQARYSDATPFDMPQDWVERVSEYYSSFESLTGELGNWQRLRAVVDDETALLHFVTHGIRCDLDHGRPGLLVARWNDVSEHSDDPAAQEAVDAELMSTLAAPPVVFVGACDTGQGAMRLGDAGVTDLTAPWLLAGAECVILPPGQVSLLASLTFAEHWHRCLASGAPPAEAVRQARLKLRSLPDYQHPAHSHWIVTGLGDARLFERSTTLQPSTSSRRNRVMGVVGTAIVAAGIVTFAIVGWQRRRRR